MSPIKCDVCGDVIDDENTGQITAEDVICIVCLESLLRKDTYGDSDIYGEQDEQWDEEDEV